MKRKLLFVGLLALAATVRAQQTPPNQIPASARPVTAQDVSPPIPIIKGVVDSVVKEQQAIVLTPEQMEEIKRTTARARETEPFQYPNKFIAKPVVRPIYIEPDATQQPRMLRLFMGTITSIVFSDLSGNPWFVKSVTLDCGQFDDGRTCQRGGNAGSQQVQPSNIVKLQPLKPYAYGSIVIELEDLASPVTFMLSTGQSNENDIRIEARVAGRNPNAKPQPMVLDKMPEHDPVMGDFLDGVPPQGAQRLKVGGGIADGWILNGALYLRTRLSILSPAFTNHVGSADGMHVYKFFSVIPTILASASGKTMALFVSGY